ncbi:MAG: beta-lactamase family protein [Chthonomonas sp.]|nr:beta-lactamase family protein [Chthonomonas sp.]
MITALLLTQTPSLEAQIDALIRDNKVPGIAVVVRKKGKNIVRIAKGYANLETSTKMSLDSVHELASVSKQFTATAAMRLVEMGKLSLDAPLSQFVDEAPESWQRVKVQHLLEHTNGLPDYLSPDLDLGVNTSLSSLIRGIKGKPLLFEPGSKWAYSNSGYMVLGHVIERASGQSFTAILNSEVISKAGMKSACVANPTQILPNRAYGYSKSGGGWKNEMYVSSVLSACGDGMMMSSANDLLAWHNALVKGQILSNASWQKMWTPTPQSQGRYGFGFGVERAGAKPRLLHSGAWVGTGTFLMSDIETDSAIIILVNCDQPPIKDLIEAAYAKL